MEVFVVQVGCVPSQTIHDGTFVQQLRAQMKADAFAHAGNYRYLTC
jgi:hypothetical protein